MAGFAGFEGDSTIQADIVDHGTINNRQLRNADKWLDEYLRAMGIDPETEGAGASGWVDWDTTSASGRDLLFHGRRSR